jgi:hypothetical protein
MKVIQPVLFPASADFPSTLAGSYDFPVEFGLEVVFFLIEAAVEFLVS